MAKKVLITLTSLPTLIGFLIVGAQTFIYPSIIYRYLHISGFVFVIVIACINLFIQIPVVLKRSSLLLLITSVLFVVFSYISEQAHFPNYLFSTYHFHLLNTHLLIIISLSLYLNRIFKYEGLLSVLLSLIIFYFIHINLPLIFNNLGFIIAHPNISYDQKMSYKVGDNLYEYIKFVKNNTPPTAKILIPPQAFPWGRTGNMPYMRYFLYPRQLINGEENRPGTNLKVTQVDYVLIAWGEESQTQNSYTHGWPKFSINSSQIMLLDKHQTIYRNSTQYNYSQYSDKEYWGLIAVNKSL